MSALRNLPVVCRICGSVVDEPQSNVSGSTTIVKECEKCKSSHEFVYDHKGNCTGGHGLRDDATDAILAAVTNLCSEVGTARRIRASEIAEAAGTDPSETVWILQALKGAGRVDFYRSGGGDPEHSSLGCPA